MNHSCLPNCSTFMVNNLAFTVVQKDIAAGEELTMAFVVPDIPYDLRRSLLRDVYNMRCFC